MKGKAVPTRKAFTLAEMLAVLGIMLLLAAASFGVLNMVAQRAGPEATIPMIQAMVNNARDYAVTNNRQTCIAFSTTPTGDGSTMELQYNSGAPGATHPWPPVPNRQPVILHNQIYVCNGFPTALASTVQNIVPVSGGATKVTTEDAAKAQKAEDGLRDVLTNFAMSGGKISTGTGSVTAFYIVLEPNGCLSLDSNSVNAVSVIQVGGSRVGTYAFYILNRIAGTPLIFE